MEKILLIGVATHWLVSGFKKITYKSSEKNKSNTATPRYLQIVMSFKDYILTPIIFTLLIYFSARPLTLPYLTVQPHSWRWYTIVTLIIISILLKIWAYQALGNSWSDKLRVDTEIKLVTTGPYKYLRHPIYTSYVIFFILVVLSGNIFLPLFFFVFVFCNFIREEEEERQLKKCFPEYTEMEVKISSVGILGLMIIITTMISIVNNILIIF
jgi:protein-S-isoprenylcysteine O-methyltransferase Ste14